MTQGGIEVKSREIGLGRWTMYINISTRTGHQSAGADRSVRPRPHSSLQGVITMFLGSCVEDRFVSKLKAGLDKTSAELGTEEVDSGRVASASSRAMAQL